MCMNGDAAQNYQKICQRAFATSRSASTRSEMVCLNGDITEKQKN